MFDMTDPETKERSIRNEERLDALENTVSTIGGDVKEIRGLVISVMKNEIPHMQKLIECKPNNDKRFWLTVFTVGGVGYLILEYSLRFIAHLLGISI